MASGPGERARLLSLTREVILARGVTGLSLSELARSIGSNNRMLLYHFGSLEELLAAAVDDILGGTVLLDRLDGLLRSPGTAPDRLGAAWQEIAERLPQLRVVLRALRHGRRPARSLCGLPGRRPRTVGAVSPDRGSTPSTPEGDLP
ncbi:TetR/AcrR family transcriptional regulator [Amycolatopsis saalfeldensis]|uniref:Regulatory protein, tetR family n=1 Tax=Amycolatopsis saalfeldensis TaxID=394193 RepID=A0A1H8Y9Q3_9PSEU|nr:TetR/AcrR family transcriptional regulator [Amycolatopsis saalfeldensis]SEP48885.1 regulatory protein, tetR family [Amycolatopsis saalfeldensis]